MYQRYETHSHGMKEIERKIERKDEMGKRGEETARESADTERKVERERWGERKSEIRRQMEGEGGRERGNAGEEGYEARRTNTMEEERNYWHGE